MTLERNRADLERHARDFAARSGFTHTVLDPSNGSVIGCVSIYPDSKGMAIRAHLIRRAGIDAKRPGQLRSG